MNISQIQFFLNNSKGIVNVVAKTGLFIDFF